MSISELPIWIQASIVSFFIGAFLIVLCLAMYALEAFPRVYEMLCRALGDDDA